MNAVIQPQFLSLAEFLEWENAQDTRHEFLDGEIIAMTGGTFAHARLTSRLVTRLANHLDQTPCVALASDLKVQATENIFYPDIVVTCHPQENDDLICRQPKLIIEVLSTSTASRDRTKKRLAYQRIDSLEEYVLVSQEAKHIEIYRRTDDWQATISIQGDVEFHCLDLSLPIDEIYAGVY